MNRLRIRPHQLVLVIGVLVALGTVAYLGLQIQVLGVVLRAVFDLPGAVPAMAIGLVIVLVYSVLGGMIAGVYTDVLQGGLMVGAAVAVNVSSSAAEASVGAGLTIIAGDGAGTGALNLSASLAKGRVASSPT